MNRRIVYIITAALVATSLMERTAAHVTIRTTGRLTPSGYATVNLTVPNERHVDTVSVVLEVPEAFLLAGGRVSRVEYPSDWTVRLEKEEKPADVYSRETADRAERDRVRREAATDHVPPDDETARAERELMDQLRRQWIKRVIFESGAIPPDGFREFRLSLQIPDTAGRYRFPATQIYADGKKVGWTQLVEGAERPAPELVIEGSSWTNYAWLVVVVAAVGFAGWSFRRRPARTEAVTASNRRE